MYKPLLILLCCNLPVLAAADNLHTASRAERETQGVPR